MSLVSRRERLRKAVELPNDPCVMSKESETETQLTEPDASQVIPDHDPQIWHEDFVRWVLERCAVRDDHEDAGGIGCLLLDFAEWAIDHDAVPCQRAVFEALLTEAGFPLKDGLAAGIVLKVDLEAVLFSQAAPEASGTPARQSLTGAGSGHPQNLQNSRSTDAVSVDYSPICGRIPMTYKDLEKCGLAIIECNQHHVSKCEGEPR